MKLPPMIDIVPGLRIVPESATYTPSEPVSGVIKYFDELSKVQVRRFHLVNSICKPSEMDIFNLSQLNRVFLEKVNLHIDEGSCMKAFSITWDASSGIL